MTIKSRLDDVGIDRMCELIEGGASHADMSRMFEISTAAISWWLNKPQHIDQSARARLASAESWLDKGLDAVEKSLRRDGEYDPAAAKAYEQACARRAALRNPQYREKTLTEHSGPNGGPIETIERRIVDPMLLKHDDPADSNG